MPETCQVRVSIKGRVQGVWFRGWTVREARRLGLDGWIRNLADGSVDAVFSGPKRPLRRLIELGRGGPPHAEGAAIDERPFEGTVEPGFRQVR
jgi:acylphosphatase